MSDLADAMSQAVAVNELMRYSDLNAGLPIRLREPAGNTTASRLLEQLNGQMVRHQFALSLVPGRPKVSLPEHLAIIDAVRARDPQGAERAMRDHIGSVIRALTAFGSADARSLTPGIERRAPLR